MLLLYARYAFLFWLLIGRNRGEVQLLKKLLIDIDLLEFSSCTSRCLENKQTLLANFNVTGNSAHVQLETDDKQWKRQQKKQNFLDCFQSCDQNMSKNSSKLADKKSKTFRKIYENLYLKMICRTENSLSFRIDLEQHGIANRTASKKPPANIVYIIQINTATDVKESILYLSDENIFTIENLQHKTNHNLSVLAMHPTNEYSSITHDQQFATLRRGYQPNNITNVNVTQFVADETQEHKLRARVEWQPSIDMGCFYELMVFDTNGDDMTRAEIQDPRDLYSYYIGNIALAGLYKVGIRALNPYNHAESHMRWRSFKAPTCFVWSQNKNYTLCAPELPINLTVQQAYVGRGMLALNISWAPPKRMPDFYTLHLVDLQPLSNKTEYSIQNDAYMFYIPQIEMLGSHFMLQLTASTEMGNATASETFEVVSIRDRSHLRIYMTVAAPIFGLSLLALFILFVLNRRAKVARYKERCIYLEDFKKVVPPIPPILAETQISLGNNASLVASTERLFIDDKMEVEPELVELKEVLGEGAFGLVRRGIYEGRDVAVKMLRDEPTKDDVRAFKCEIAVMKSVGSHPNIVGIVAHCTRRLNCMMLLTEYCSLGSLLDFLRNEWSFVRKRNAKFPLRPQILKRYKKYIKPSVPKSTAAYVNDRNSVCQMSTSGIEEIVYSGATPRAASYESLNLCSGRKPAAINAADNESYGIERSYSACDNACKCEVNVRGGNLLTNILHVDISTKIVQIKNCECGSRKTRTRRTICIAQNAVYFKGTGAAHLQKSNEECNRKAITEREPLNELDFIDIAQQVAVGMEFLAKNKVVHRDLAARNVLVAADRKIKIADFGLSRDIYRENIYKKTGDGKLPIKWLAMESLTHQVYTTQSDVWSYGILLYEISTLGSTPYPSIESGKLLNLLRAGFRMSKPDDCSDEFYNLMIACWNAVPNERPTFTEIIQYLTNLMATWNSDYKEIEKQQVTVDKNTLEKTEITNFGPHCRQEQEDSYLQPLQ